jgi:autotransporter-associated beta strand protein
LFLAAGFANQTAAISNLSGTGGSIDPRSGGSASIRTLQVNQTVDGTFAGSLVSDGAGARQLALIKNGVATLTLSSAAGNTYFGATTINAGGLVVSGQLRNTSSLTVNNGATLELGATNMFTTGHGVAMADSRVITVNGSTLLMNASMDSRIGNVTLNNGATWTSNRPTTAFDVLLGDTSVGAATVTVSGTGAATMNGTGGINLLGVQNFSVANTTGNADPDLVVSMTLSERLASGTGGFNKTGPGTMLLTGINDYTGGTTVSAGTLVVTGSIAASSLTTVASAATLGGTGSVGATLIQGGGFHSPGTSPGIQTVTNGLEYQSAATLTWELFANTTAGRGTSYDGIDLTGGSLVIDPGAILTLDFGTLAGGSSVSWSNSFWGSDQSWTIIDVGGTGAWNGSLFGVLSVGPDALGQSLASVRPDASFSVANEGGHLTLQYTAVPEPATLVLAAAGLVALAAAAGRRL